MGTAVSLRLVGAPWPVVAILATVLTGVHVVALVLPQRSRDRLDWWIAFWQRKPTGTDRHHG
jgi:hypothetical protein